MLHTPEFLAEITRYLNNPDNENYRLTVEKFRSISSENELYFLEIERIWKLSSSAARVQYVNDTQFLFQAKQESGYKLSSKNKFSWWRAIAASLFLLVSIYWLFYKGNKEVYTIIKTSQYQIDSVSLSDGSVIVLAENSQLKYSNSFASLRNVVLTQGKAFFKIAKDPSRPFNVSINQSVVTVLGTSFNISVTKGKIDLGVISGKVTFKPDENSNASVLTAGQAVSYDVEKRELLAKDAQNVDSWLTKELVFVDTPLEEVCKQLTAYYGQEIKLQNPSRTHKKLNASFKSQSLNQVLEVLDETYDIKINRENNQINLITP